MTNDNRKIVVTGATGGLGSDVVTQLLRFAPAEELGVSVRRPEGAANLAVRGVRVRHGDFDKRKILNAAFAGAERLLVISTRTVENHARFAQHRNAIDAAKRCAIRHVCYTSVVQRAGSLFDLAPGHLDTESYLAKSGLAHTILHNGHYVEDLPMFLGASIGARRAAAADSFRTSVSAQLRLIP